MMSTRAPQVALNQYKINPSDQWLDSIEYQKLVLGKLHKFGGSLKDILPAKARVGRGLLALGTN